MYCAPNLTLHNTNDRSEHDQLRPPRRTHSSQQRDPDQQSPQSHRSRRKKKRPQTQTQRHDPPHRRTAALRTLTSQILAETDDKKVEALRTELGALVGIDEAKWEKQQAQKNQNRLACTRANKILFWSRADARKVQRILECLDEASALAVHIVQKQLDQLPKGFQPSQELAALVQVLWMWMDKLGREADEFDAEFLGRVLASSREPGRQWKVGTPARIGVDAFRAAVKAQVAEREARREAMKNGKGDAVKKRMV